MIVALTSATPTSGRHAQLAEPRGSSGGFDVTVHQCRDGVQRVEQEMWMELLLKRPELGFDEARLELRVAGRAWNAMKDGVAEANRPVASFPSRNYCNSSVGTRPGESRPFQPGAHRTDVIAPGRR
jgi:hypothetical protein